MILAIDKIRTDGGTQSRAQIDGDIVEEYAHVFLTSPRFPLPPVVVFYDGKEYWLADGFHRLAAAKLAAKTELRVDVIQGTQREAILYSVGANAKHGLRRTNADKRRAVETLLRDEEWSKKSDRWIAEKCCVSPDTVGRIRKEQDQQVSDSDTSTRTGQDGKEYPAKPKKREQAPVDPYPDAPWIRNGDDPEYYMTPDQRGEYRSLRDTFRDCARDNMLRGTSIEDALRRANNAQKELDAEPAEEPHSAQSRIPSAPPAPMPQEPAATTAPLTATIRDTLAAKGANAVQLERVAALSEEDRRKVAKLVVGGLEINEAVARVDLAQWWKDALARAKREFNPSQREGALALATEYLL